MNKQDRIRSLRKERTKHLHHLSQGYSKLEENFDLLRRIYIDGPQSQDDLNLIKDTLRYTLGLISFNIADADARDNLVAEGIWFDDEVLCGERHEEKE